MEKEDTRRRSKRRYTRGAVSEKLERKEGAVLTMDLSRSIRDATDCVLSLGKKGRFRNENGDQILIDRSCHLSADGIMNAAQFGTRTLSWASRDAIPRRVVDAAKVPDAMLDSAWLCARAVFGPTAAAIVHEQEQADEIERKASRRTTNKKARPRKAPAVDRCDMEADMREYREMARAAHTRKQRDAATVIADYFCEVEASREAVLVIMPGSEEAVRGRQRNLNWRVDPHYEDKSKRRHVKRQETIALNAAARTSRL